MYNNNAINSHCIYRNLVMAIGQNPYGAMVNMVCWHLHDGITHTKILITEYLTAENPSKQKSPTRTIMYMEIKVSDVPYLRISWH